MQSEKEFYNEETQAAIDVLLAKADKLEESNLEELLVIYNEVIDLAKQVDYRSALAEGYHGKAQVLWKLAEPVKAHTYYEKSLSIHTALGSHYGISKCYCGMGIIAAINAEFAVALEHFEKAISGAKKAENERFSHVLISNVGNVYFNMGRYADALACFKTAENYYQKTEDNNQLAHVYSGMAGVLVFQGNPAQGLAYLKRSLVLHSASKNTFGVATILSNMGRTLQKQGKLKEAEQQFFKALEYARNKKLRSLEYDVNKHLSALYSEMDLPEKSAHHLAVFMEGEQDMKKEMLRKKNEQFRRFGGIIE